MGTFHSENYQNYSDTNIVLFIKKLAQIFFKQQSFQSLFSNFHFSQLFKKRVYVRWRYESIHFYSNDALFIFTVRSKILLDAIELESKGIRVPVSKRLFSLKEQLRMPLSYLSLPNEAHRATSISAFNISIANRRLYRTTKIVIVTDKGLISREI